MSFLLSSSPVFASGWGLWAEKDTLEEFLPIDYDEILAFGDQFVMCSKTESGFSSTETRYGVYNWAQDYWAFDYEDGVIPNCNEYFYMGEGLFCACDEERGYSAYQKPGGQVVRPARAPEIMGGNPIR